MRLQVYLTVAERDTLEAIMYGKVNGNMKLDQFRLLPFTKYNVQFPRDTKDTVVITLNELQSIIYRNLGTEFNFVYKWKVEVM